jgi:hypothetical protein
MNEHQHSGENIDGRRDSPLASAGGNSPVLGSPVLDSGRSAALDRSGPQQFGDRRAPSHAEVPHRMATRRDETRRAGEHQYEYERGVRRPPDTHEDYNPLIVAASIGGGAVFGWLLARLSSPHGREHHWYQDSRSGPQRQSREHRSYERDTYDGRGTGHASSPARSVETDETWNLIASDKVEGTAVYDRKGERLGSVYNFMVGKRSGQVAYAVMSFGGWLGMGQSYHPLPWDTLRYDTDLGGYIVSLDKDRLRSAPSHTADQDTSSDASYWRRVKDYWA